MLLVMFAPLLALANSGDAVTASPPPQISIFDELKGFSAKIRSSLIPNYSGNPYGLLTEVKNRFSEATRVANQWFSETAAAIKDKAQYAFDRLARLEGYVSDKSIFNEAKNFLAEKFNLFSP